MNAIRQPSPSTPPTLRTRRVLAGQPVPSDVVPSFRSQEGEFAFVAPRPAANEARMHNGRAADGQWNVAMVLCTLVLVVALCALGYGLAILAAAYVDPMVTFLYEVPMARGIALVGFHVAVLAVGMVIRLAHIRRGALA